MYRSNCEKMNCLQIYVLYLFMILYFPAVTCEYFTLDCDRCVSKPALKLGSERTFIFSYFNYHKTSFVTIHGKHSTSFPVSRPIPWERGSGGKVQV